MSIDNANGYTEMTVDNVYTGAQYTSYSANLQTSGLCFVSQFDFYTLFFFSSFIYNVYIGICSCMPLILCS